MGEIAAGDFAHADHAYVAAVGMALRAHAHPTALIHKTTHEPIADAMRGVVPRAQARYGVDLFKLAVERSFAMLSQAKRDVQLSRLRWLIAVENCRSVIRRLGRQRKYDSNQPRVPAGNADGGQWTSEGGGAGRNDPRVISDAAPDNFFKPGARLSANDRLGYPINLYDEEAFGHTIEKHVNKTPEALIRQAREAFVQNPDAFDSRSGSFSSIEAATKLTNSTIAQNQAIVDQVASGMRLRDVVITHFPSITGIEAVVPSVTSPGYIRETYGVGVVIIYDRLSPRGFRILSAFPTNR